MRAREHTPHLAGGLVAASDGNERHVIRPPGGSRDG